MAFTSPPAPWVNSMTGPSPSTNMNSFAYTSVQARRTLQSPSSAPQPIPPAAALQDSSKRAFKDYVTRAFAEENSRPGVTSQEITTKIKAMVEEAKARYIIDHIDWNTQALPQDLIETEYGPRANGFAGETQFDLVTTAQLSGSRKRKSTEAAPLNTNPARPNKKKPNSLADRISKTHISKPQSVTTKSKFGDLEKRRQRFDVGNNGMGTTVQLQSPINDYTATNDDGPIVGTSEKLEKNFLRLTSAPNPAQVRSLPTLQLTLHFLINRWRDDHNYAYTCDQFKSLRQDLTVQHIKSEFTVRVYEAHARIALEQSDMGEYNQCQTQLTALYKENVPGCCGEFLAYRILYSLFTRDRASIGNLLADLTSADKRHAAVIHALQVRKALAAGNYHQYFKLYDDAPNMGGYLMDKSIDRERLAALARICKGYKQLPLAFVSSELSFPGQEDCAQFICDNGGAQLLEQVDDGVRFMCANAGQVFG